MAANFDRWEKDPFFSAAEEVQESTDRMESTYRTWIHETKDQSNLNLADQADLRRDLQTALGTAKWQLEEFERAVRLSYVENSGENATNAKRHSQFINAIRTQIGVVENSLKGDSHDGQGKRMHWVRLDQGERDELAAFLSGLSVDKRDMRQETGTGPFRNSTSLRNSGQGAKPGSGSGSEEKPKEEDKLHAGHRRVASAADIGSWKIAVGDVELQQRISDAQPDCHIPKIASFSGIANTVESMTKMKSTKNGFRKWTLADRHLASDILPLQSNELTRGVDVCYERSKSCLDSCDETYNKHIYGWLGAVHRQLQRSQYQIQYNRPLQVAMWVAVTFCMLVVFVVRAI